jgi:hypothetical protein
MEIKTTYTKKQINDFKKYEAVRKSGRYNMFDRRALIASGLDKDEYLFVMDHYSKLNALVQDFNANEYLINQTDKS